MDEASHQRLPIANLNPLVDTSTTSVHGVVTIIWPYSSSQRALSFLLVEPDFRLRLKQGQVRVAFYGASAKAVAESGITSGDEIDLQLKGATWQSKSPTTDTPGRSVDWDLAFGRHLKLAVGGSIVLQSRQ
jgi:hypothetical protein